MPSGVQMYEIIIAFSIADALFSSLALLSSACKEFSLPKLMAVLMIQIQFFPPKIRQWFSWKHL